MRSFEQLLNAPPSPLQALKEPLFRDRKIQVLLKRDDLLVLPREVPSSPFCGNKWRKLKYNLLEADQNGHHSLLTFGGAYSNHLAAVAAAGKLFDFKTIGIVRGEATLPLNPTLHFAQACGMQLQYVDRQRYRQKMEPAVQQEFQAQFGSYYMLPEGGTNPNALRGAAEIAEELKQQLEDTRPDYLLVCCGTGGTMAGLLQGWKHPARLLGISVLKGNFLTKAISSLLPQTVIPEWQVLNSFHHGGYAKFTPELIQFINRFWDRYQIYLDPIYTGKLLFAVYQLAAQAFFEPGTSVVVIHSGGLQGIAGFNQRFGPLLKAVPPAAVW